MRAGLANRRSTSGIDARRARSLVALILGATTVACDRALPRIETAPVVPVTALAPFELPAGSRPLRFLSMNQSPDAGGGPTLEELAIRRRVERRPDPLTVEIGPSSRLVVDFPDQPFVDVRLVNTDVDRVAFQFTSGGNYRSGRLSRWRIDLDPEGTRIRAPHDGFDGGFYSVVTMPFGESYPCPLSTVPYYGELLPQSGTLRVLYHDSVAIADEFTTDGLVVFASKSVEYAIRPRVIRVTSAMRERVDGALRVLDGEPTVRTYSPPCGAITSWTSTPTSVHGALLREGWEAFDALYARVDDPTLTLRQRAWVLAMLYSASGLVDPCTPGCVEAVVRSNLGELTHPHYGRPDPASTTIVHDRPLSAETQSRYVQAWLDMSPWITVEAR